MRASLLIVILSMCFGAISAQNATISGHITDSETGEILIGAHVYDIESGYGTTSNEYGFYSISLSKERTCSLSCSYLGYYDAKLALTISNDTIINFRLKPGIEVGEVKVTASVYKQHETHGNLNLPVKLVKLLPSFGGEFDIMKTLQLMPGVQSGSEGNSGLYVRGGGPDQNLVLLDDVPLYYVNHLAGFISTFNADAINNVNLIKGGFPARYGGRLSSILDIRMKDGNMKEFQGSGSIGIVSSKIAIEGPIKVDTSSYILSARRFMYDLITMPLTKLAEDNVIGYTFYDLNAKLNHKFSDKDRIYFSLYTGDDSSLALYNDPGEDNDRSKARIRWGNLVGAYRWNHIYNQKLFSNLSLSYSKFRFITKTSDIQDTGDSEYRYQGQFSSTIRDLGAKIDFSYYPGPRQSISFGGGTLHHTFHPWTNSYYISEDDNVILDTITGINDFSAWEHFVYIDDKIDIGRFLNIRAGVRGSWYVSDKLNYKRFDPRIALNVTPDQNTQLSLSYSEMQQYVHLLSYSNVGIPIDLWMPATENVPPSLSRQLSVGLTRKIFNSDYDISLEYYSKRMNNLIEYKPGVSIIESTEDWQDLIEKDGKGNSHGIELLLRKNTGSTTGWIGYTWSKTTHQFANLNNGNPYPFKFDRRHDISLVLMHKISENIDISAIWVYGTGNAFSLPVGKYNTSIDDGQYYDGEPERIFHPAYIYAERNNYRMRSYHRMDFGANFRKDTRRGERTWNISIFNLYNRKNPYFYFMDYNWDNGKTTLKQKSLFPFMPSVSYSFKF
jgi:hypothetical protein